MSKQKTISYVVDSVDNVEDLIHLPEEVKEAMVSEVKYKRYESKYGGTYWAAEDVKKIPRGAEIHKDVIIGPEVELSTGIEIGEGSIIGKGSKIGKNTVIGKNVRIDKDCEIGEEVVIADSVQIDNEVTIANKSGIGTGAHIFDSISVDGVVENGGKVVEDYHKTEPEQEEDGFLTIELELKRK